MIAGPRHFAALAGRLRWDPDALDLSYDASRWPKLPPARRAKLSTLLAGFWIAEYAVAEQLAPFAAVADDPAVAAVFAAQRADEERHARLFDRIAAGMLGGRARGLAPPAVIELFERRLPATAAALAAGRTGLADGVALYHLILEGIVLSAGQRALLDDLADGALPGVRAGVELVERDERWHVGFGLRCLLELRPERRVLASLLDAGESAASAWGPAVPAQIRTRAVVQHRRRLAAIGVLPGRALGHAADDRAA